MEKCLLNFKEFCEYTGFGKTKARQLLKDKNCTYCIRYGNRLLALKPELDKQLQKCAKYHIDV